MTPVCPPAPQAATAPAPPSTAEAALIRRAQAGDTRAFSQLVADWLPLLYPFLLRMTGDAEQAEDLCQETFIKVFRHLRGFDARRRFKPWLFRIAVNTAKSAFRARHGALVPMEEAFLDADPAAPDQTQALECRLNGELALQALMRLDIRYRQALWLRYQEELSYDEVADVMAIPLNTVRTRIRRGLDALRRELTGVLNP